MSHSPDDVYIIGGCRTIIGSFQGTLSNFPAWELGVQVVKECLMRANIAPSDVDTIIMGQTLTAAQGQNPARQTALKGGFPESTTAYTVNMLCGSGLKAVHLGWQALKSGEANAVIVGGQENMTMAPHTCQIRTSPRMGPVEMQDSLQVDGLTDAIHQVPMGMTAEFLAQSHKVSRADQDAYALESQKKAHAAIESGHFRQEIVRMFKRLTLDSIILDEFPKPDTTLERLALLKPAFKNNGTVTAGNSSGINDGAAALALMTRGMIHKKQNVIPIAKIVGFAEAGVKPMKMGLAPVSAIEFLLEKISWEIPDVDLFELNEAFAVQSILCIEMLNLDKDKVNVSGGAIALGHPIGASGARILVTLMYNLKRLNKKKGVAAICIGGGMAIAIAIEMV